MPESAVILQSMGQDASVYPVVLPSSYAHKAVNRTFRRGIDSTRPPFQELILYFESDEDEQVFRYGNVQGTHFYNGIGSGSPSGIVVSIAGSVFFVNVSGVNGYVTKINEGQDREVMHVWFAQGEEQLYWQNGKESPRAWDGVSTRVIEGEGKMPIGTIMIYAHGRMVVSDSLNRIVISDHFNGAGVGERRNMDNFLENTYFIGGFFTPPASIGEITGIHTIPSQFNRFNQGSIVIGCENGFAVMDISPQRNEWQDAVILFSGSGNSSNNGMVSVNNDLWYRRPDGIGSVSESRSSESSGWAVTSISKEVSYWIDNDSPHLKEFTCACFHKNRIIYTCLPETTPSVLEEAGFHRSFSGFVVADVDKGSTTVNEPALRWEGIWTGLNATGMETGIVDGESRCLIMSLDSSGKNRLFEIMDDADIGNDRYDNGKGVHEDRLIESHSITSAISSFGKSGPASKKILTGPFRIQVGVSGQAAIKTSYSADCTPSWSDLGGYKEINLSGLSPLHGAVPASRYEIWTHVFPDSPSGSDCKMFIKNKAASGFSFQFRFDMVGRIALAVREFVAELIPESSSHCEPDEYVQIENIESCCDSILAYNII